MKKPTKKQLNMLRAIDRFIKSHGMSPTYIELAAELNLEYAQNVKDYFRRLQRDGWIDRERLVSRGVTLTEQYYKVLR